MLKLLSFLPFLRRFGVREVFHAAPLLIEELRDLRRTLINISDLLEDVIDENTDVEL